MKNIYKIMTLALAMIVSASCINDLNTLPMNPSDSTSESAYADEASYLSGLAYINAYWSFVSQGDPGSSDLSFSDAGQSELLRQWFNLNELSTDSFKCVWGDDYLSGLEYGNWTPDNDAIIAVYTRCMKGITLANEYLLQTTSDKLNARGHSAFAGKVAGYRAEARFHRALFNWVMMDLFGNPPYATEANIGGEYPKQIGREALYAKIEAELLDLLSEGSAMPKVGEVPYPRPTQGSVAALLARMYLNAEVYTGVANWEGAKEYAAKTIAMGYTLASDYDLLFRQDNGTNGAQNEFIFAIDYDKDSAQSWGGTTTLISASFNDDLSMNLNKFLGYGDGSSHVHFDRWAGYHVADDYVAYFDLKNVVWGGDGIGYDREASDKRAYFCNKGNVKTFDMTQYATGWSCWKFNPFYTDGHYNTDSVNNYKFSSIDFPLFRLAEQYLIYAEADARLSGGETTDATALAYIKALRDRAGVAMPDAVNLDFLLAERARELMWEGHRRTDLIRYGYFTSMQFPWSFKGGVADGKASLPAFRTIYPIIQDDLNANNFLVQNPGY